MNDKEFMKSIGWTGADSERDEQENPQESGNAVAPFDYSTAPVPFENAPPSSANHAYTPRGSRRQQRGQPQSTFDPYTNFSTLRSLPTSFLLP